MNILVGIVIAVFTLIIAAFLSWVSKHLYGWWCTRIQCKKHPKINIVLMRRTAGYVTPKPILWIKLEGLEVFTRQPDGFYSLKAILRIADKEVLKLSLPKSPYTKWMDLDYTHTFERELSNWDYWEKSDTSDNVKILADSTLTSWLLINDRRCTLTKSQKINRIEFWE